MFNLVISNVPGPKDALYLNGAHLDEVYPVSIPTHYLALNITISGYRDQPGLWLHRLSPFGACAAAHAGLHPQRHPGTGGRSRHSPQPALHMPKKPQPGVLRRPRQPQRPVAKKSVKKKRAAAPAD
jgi:hypothetical protein